MALPPAGYSVHQGFYFTPEGEGPYTWDGVNMLLVGQSAPAAPQAPEPAAAARSAPPTMWQRTVKGTKSLLRMK